MNRFIILLLILFPISLFSQWNQVYMYDNQIYTLDVVGPDTVYVAGFHCAIYTNDGGTTWADINYDCSNIVFNDILFPTSDIGYMCGNSKFIKTINGGKNWSIINQDTLVQYLKMDFISADSGWIIGANTSQGDVIMRTYNGGVTWDYLFFNDLEFTDIDMIDSNIGYITHDFGVLKTTDGGNTWDPLITENVEGFFTCCDFLNQDTGYVGAYGLYKTYDGGNSWSYITEENAIGYLSLSVLQFINTDTAYYVGYEAASDIGEICTSEDEGSTWNRADGRYVDIEMYDNEIGYCIEWTGEIYKTINGGITVGLNEHQDDNNICIYPNPFNNYLIIYNNTFDLNNNSIYEFGLMDLKGNVVFRKFLKESSKTIYELNSLKPGLYLYQIKSDNQIIKTGKIVKRGN